MSIDVVAKRVYDPVSTDDGYRVLIDHVWPRGISRDRAKLDAWERELAPTDELRRWFNHDPGRFEEFRARYRDELAGQGERLAELPELARRAGRERLTILYAARDRDHNNAVVVVELLGAASAGSGCPNPTEHDIFPTVTVQTSSPPEGRP